MSLETTCSTKRVPEQLRLHRGTLSHTHTKLCYCRKHPVPTFSPSNLNSVNLEQWGLFISSISFQNHAPPGVKVHLAPPGSESWLHAQPQNFPHSLPKYTARLMLDNLLFPWVTFDFFQVLLNLDNIEKKKRWARACHLASTDTIFLSWELDHIPDTPPMSRTSIVFAEPWNQNAITHCL